MEWVKDQFKESLNTYDADCFCIYDATGKRLTPTLDSELRKITQDGQRMPDQLAKATLERAKHLWLEATSMELKAPQAPVPRISLSNVVTIITRMSPSSRYRSVKRSPLHTN